MLHNIGPFLFGHTDAFVLGHGHDQLRNVVRLFCLRPQTGGIGLAVHAGLVRLEVVVLEKREDARLRETRTGFVHSAVLFYNQGQFPFEIDDLLLADRGCAFDSLVDDLHELRIQEVVAGDADVELGSELIHEQTRDLLPLVLRFLLTEKGLLWVHLISK